MYGWIWSKLPGNWALKTLESVVLVALIAGTLVVVVFPWVEPKLPFSGNTVDGGGGVSNTDSPTPSAKPTGVSTGAPSPTTSTIPGGPTSSAGTDELPGD